MIFDWTDPEEWKVISPSACKEREDAAAFVKHLENSWEIARTGMEKAQAAMVKQANRKRREVDFGVGDSVYLNLKDYPIKGRPSRKLSNQNAGPFKITEKVGNAFKIELPPSMKIHPVISPDKLRLAACDPLPGQAPPEPDPTQIDGEDEWEVEEIVDSWLYRGKLRYRAKWVGYDDDATWYPASDFEHSPHLLRRFHDIYPDKPGPPQELPAWIRAWEEEGEGDDATHDAIGQPMQIGKDTPEKRPESITDTGESPPNRRKTRAQMANEASRRAATQN